MGKPQNDSPVYATRGSHDSPGVKLGIHIAFPFHLIFQNLQEYHLIGFFRFVEFIFNPDLAAIKSLFSQLADEYTGILLQFLKSEMGSPLYWLLKSEMGSLLAFEKL